MLNIVSELIKSYRLLSKSGNGILHYSLLPKTKAHAVCVVDMQGVEIMNISLGDTGEQMHSTQLSGEKILCALGIQPRFVKTIMIITR